MIFDYLTENRIRFKNINKILEESYDYVINYEADLNDLINLCDSIMEESTHDNTLFITRDENYTKAKLIKEAAVIFLSEIAPGRLRKKKKTGAKGD